MQDAKLRHLASVSWLVHQYKPRPLAEHLHVPLQKLAAGMRMQSSRFVLSFIKQDT
jgi:hypothetical protein